MAAVVAPIHPVGSVVGVAMVPWWHTQTVVARQEEW